MTIVLLQISSRNKLTFSKPLRIVSPPSETLSSRLHSSFSRETRASRAHASYRYLRKPICAVNLVELRNATPSTKNSFAGAPSVHAKKYRDLGEEKKSLK